MHKQLHRPARHAAAFALFTALALAPALGSAYTLEFGKWDDPTLGTGATVTWSLITNTVGVNPAYQSPNSTALDFLTGNNSLATFRGSVDATFGAGAFDGALSRAMATWSAAANIHFVSAADNGATFAGTTAIDIRIGAYAFNPACCSGAAGFGPPGNDLLFPDPLAGDLAINTANNFTIATGAEGAALPVTGPGVPYVGPALGIGIYLNDVEGLLLHELGHTLGLGHSDHTDSVMCGFVSNAFDGSTCDYQHINRVLTADDIAGIQALYGAPVPVPLPATAWLLLAGLASLFTFARRSEPHRDAITQL
jgi:hypothetical protein